MNTEYKEFQKKFNLKKQFDESRSWPTCFEKSLIACIYHASLSANEASKIEELNSILIKEYDLMCERLKIEGLESEEYKKKISLCKVLSHSNLSLALKELVNILKDVRKLDIKKIEEICSEIKRAENELTDKDVILFLGPTGCGKSKYVF